MGRVKDMCIELEERFMEKASNIIGECDSYDEFIDTMEQHRDLVSHLGENDKHEMLGDLWSEHWSRFI
tara:strand:+ start:147 stop:350 length:204 start_codon:yes stop_codon:yes gene_type:complete